MTLAVGVARPQSDTPAGRTSRRGPAAPRLLAELTARTADAGGPVEVTVGELARALALAERTVQRATSALERSGHLEVHARRGGANAYSVRSTEGDAT